MSAGFSFFAELMGGVLSCWTFVFVDGSSKRESVVRGISTIRRAVFS